MAFYRKAADIIKNGETVLCDCTTESYNHPTGCQLLVRRLGNRSLAILHRFEGSQPDMSFLDGKKVLAEYGCADRDFSAQAWILEE